ncbi:conjugal transfer protein TrbL family protein [Dactylosporangium sp. CA-152071]|uniref:conjugal transfer protein TrbL family protein n=1 Tax=Dactylosporangium sp. CA-152071 TaxID=3239933 RepID=UPI003D8ED8CE
MGDWLADKVINRVLNWFAEMILATLNNLWDLLSATAFQSPNVTTLPQVTTFAGTSLGIVNACYVLAFLAVAIMVMGRDTIQSKYGPSELIPRLVIGLIAANFALPICSTIIDLANAFTAALTSQSITSPGSMQLLRSTTTSALSTQTGVSPSGFLLLLIALLIAVLAALLMIQWIMRCALLIVLAGVAPIALALHATPQTEGAAKLWWRAMIGTTGTVVIQAVALHTTLTIFLSPDANLPVLGLVILPDSGATINLLIVACLLFAILKVPGLMRRYVTQTKPGITGQIFKLVVIQQVTRGLSKGFGGGRTARAASTARPAAKVGWPTK